MKRIGGREVVSYEVLAAGDHRKMRWLNGGGWTSEILAWPDPGDWEWRLSVADVEQGGPFSVFPGIDRTIALLDGHGFALAIGGRPAVTLVERFEPYEFPGDEPTVCSLVDGPVQDLNLMVRRGYPPRRLTVIEVASDIALNSAGLVPIDRRLIAADQSELDNRASVDDDGDVGGPRDVDMSAGHVELAVVLAGQVRFDRRQLSRLDAIRLTTGAPELTMSPIGSGPATIAIVISN